MADSTHIIGIGLDASGAIRGLAEIEARAMRTVSAIQASVRGGLPSQLTPSLGSVAQTYASSAARSGLGGAELAASARRVGTTIGTSLSLTGQGGLQQGHLMVQEALRRHRPEMEKLAKADAETYDRTYTREMARKEAQSRVRRDRATYLSSPHGQGELIEDVRAQRTLRQDRRDAQQQDAPGATTFQRLYGRTHQTDPLEAPKLGQFLGGKALTSLGFGLTGGALYGAISGVKQLTQEALQLEKTFDLIKAQFAAVDQAGQFPGFKKGILDIATSTGETVQDVAQIALQLKGAFGNNNQEALRQTEQVVKASRVTGISVHEAIDNFTAVARTYGTTVEDVSDLALGLQDRFGVLAKESIQFLGQIAPAAKEAGFSLQELGAVAATAQEFSGRSGTAIAESLGRIIPSLQENILPLSEVVKLDPKDIASGDLGNIFFSVIKQYQSLSQENKNLVIEMLGGRREAQTLSAVFGHVNEVLAETSRTTGNAGRTQKGYAEIQKSLSQTLAELRQKFTRFALTIYESGLDDFLKGIVNMFTLLAGAIGKLASIPGMKQLIEFLLLVKALSLLKRITIFENLASNLSGLGARVGGGLGGLGGTIIPGSRFGTEGIGSLGKEVTETGGRLSRFKAGLDGAAVGAGGLAGSFGALAASIAPAIAAMLVFKAISDYQNLRGHEQGQDQSYGDSLRHVSTPELRSATGGGSTRDQFRARWTGTQTDQEQRQEEIRRRDDERLGYEIQAAQKAGYTKTINDTFSQGKGFRREAYGITASSINELAQQARDHPGNKAYYEALKQFVLELRKKLPKTVADAILADAKIHVDALGNIKTDEDLKNQPQKDQDTQLDQLAEGVSTAQENYQSGLTSFEDYAKSLRARIDTLNQVKQAAGGTLSAKNAKALADTQKQLGDLFKTQYDARIQIGEALGNLNPEQKVDLLKQELVSPEIQGNRAAMIQVAQDLTTAIKGYFDHQVKTAGSLEEALAIQKNGIKVPPELKAALTQQLKALGVENPEVPDTITQDPEVVAQKEADLRKQIRDASNQLAQANTHGDKLKQAQAQHDKAVADLEAAQHDKLGDSQSRKAAIDQAQAALIGADDAVTSALHGREDAMDSLAEAQSKHNPVQAATIRLQQAQRHLREATNKDEILAAQLQIVQAQQDLAEQVSQTMTAQANLAAAVAEAAGHQADAIGIRLNDLRRQLAELASQGGYGTAAYKNIEAEIVQQQHSLETTLRNDQKDYYEFLYATKKISATTLINYLEGLAAGIDQNTQEWRSLQQEIFSLREQLGADAQFNLPAGFSLPTLYEARRLNQEPGGGGYQDNRNINININANNTVDAQGAMELVVDTLSGPSRFGSRPRTY